MHKAYVGKSVCAPAPSAATSACYVMQSMADGNFTFTTGGPKTSVWWSAWTWLNSGWLGVKGEVKKMFSLWEDTHFVSKTVLLTDTSLQDLWLVKFSYPLMQESYSWPYLVSCSLSVLCWNMPFCVSVVSYQDQGGEQGEEYETEEQLQARILTAALEFVPLHGWSVEAIAAGSEVRSSSFWVFMAKVSWNFHMTQNQYCPAWHRLNFILWILLAPSRMQWTCQITSD